jgi:vacuole morphology and inheritance protein 14
MALSAIGLALDSRVVQHADQLIPPMCACFKHQNAEIRLAAIESMFYILKCGRKTPMLKDHFNMIFDALCSVIRERDIIHSDDYWNGRHLVSIAANTLDWLMKDLVCDSRQFNLVDFLLHLTDQLSQKPEFSPYSVMQFVLLWITILDTVPEIELVNHLDLILPGIMTMTGSTAKEIHNECVQGLLAADQEDPRLRHWKNYSHSDPSRHKILH